MKCIHCRGGMKRGRVPFSIDRHGYHLIFDEMPAWVCTQCGESYFEEKEVESVQSLIRTVDKQAEKLLASA